MDRDDDPLASTVDPPAEPRDTLDERALARASAPGILTGNRYRMTGAIGHGGMGEVVAAHDDQIGREVAIKRMRASDPSDQQIGRFMREARIQGRLEHPAIPPVHELGRDVDGRPYFAMKRLAGVTLAHILETRDAAYTPQRLLRAFAEVCLAVEFAHAHGVVHRDLKPENIMLGDFGEVYVLDWGIAKLLGDALDKDEGFAGSDSARNATAAGAAIGTPGYMPPEQVTGAPDLDARADVYALGCVLFEILAGDSLHPRGAAGMLSAVEGKHGSPAARAPDRDIAPELDALCVAATATDRARRIATARAVGERVQRYLDGDRDGALRYRLADGHLADAVAAFERADRARAMRDAARALALDPARTAAAELITRLMLEPPRDTPPEVAAALADDGRRVNVDHTRIMFFAYIALLAFVPVFFVIASIGDALAFGAAISVGMTAAFLASTGRPISIYTHLMAAVVLIGVSAQLTSVIAFPLALVTIAGFVAALNPTLDGRWSRLKVIAMLLAATGVPWLAELAGGLPATYRFDADGAHLFGDFLRGGPTITLIVAAASAVVTTIVPVLVGYSIRVKDADARRLLRLQAWQLRQLVP